MSLFEPIFLLKAQVLSFGKLKSPSKQSTGLLSNLSCERSISSLAFVFKLEICQPKQEKVHLYLIDERLV